MTQFWITSGVFVSVAPKLLIKQIYFLGLNFWEAENFIIRLPLKWYFLSCVVSICSCNVESMCGCYCSAWSDRNCIFDIDIILPISLWNTIHLYLLCKSLHSASDVNLVKRMIQLQSFLYCLQFVSIVGCMFVWIELYWGRILLTFHIYCF